MEQFVSGLNDHLKAKILPVESQEDNILQKSHQNILVLEEAFERLRTFIVGYTFKDPGEEILFFKEVKPRLFSQLVYYNQLYTLEVGMPANGRSYRNKYLRDALERIKYFCGTNQAFYRYYRSGSTHLDSYYFLRGRADIQLIPDCFYFERDAKFSTGYDFMVSMILASEMLANHINHRLSTPDDQVSHDYHLAHQVKLTWTGRKAELVELIYAWERAKCFNNGHVNIKSLARYMEEAFNIDLGDFYHIFMEMKERKGRRTPFLDKLIKYLNDRMDEADR